MVEPTDGAAASPEGLLADLESGVALLGEAAAGLVGLPEELGYATADALLDATVALDAQITRAQAVRARLLRTVDRRDAFTARGYVTAASWWREVTGRDHASAARQVRTAVRLGNLEELSAALDAAEVTLAHCEVVTSACVPGRAAAIAAAEGTLTTLAKTATPRELRVACRRIADLVDPDGSPPPNAQEHDEPAGAEDSDASSGAGDGDASNRDGGGGGEVDAAGLTGERPGVIGDPERGVWLQRGFEGRWRLAGELDPVVGERLFGLLEAFDEPDPPDTDPARRRSSAQRRHDALARLLAAAEGLPDLPTRQGTRPRALLVIDLLTLLGHDRCASRRPRLASGTELAVAAAIELLTEAAVTPVLTLGPWRPVAVGRTYRTLPAWLRPLLAAVHQHCRGPGCDRPLPWTQSSHLDPWQPGGRTDLDRTLPLCGAHHRLLDVTGWDAAYDPDTATVTWTRPDHGYQARTEPPEP